MAALLLFAMTREKSNIIAGVQPVHFFVVG